MSKTRWVAFYIAESAINEAIQRHGENWAGAVKCGRIISYKSAERAAELAAMSDIHGETKGVTEQRWDSIENGWFDVIE